MNINGKNLCTYCFEEMKDSQGPCSICGYVEGQEQPDTVLEPGTVLMGKYVVGRVLGKGGFGVTYLAYDLKRECKAAIKEYMPDALAYRVPGKTMVMTYEGEREESFRLGAEKFYEEAKTVSRFNGHPNIINVQEFFYENNTAYFVMEYIEGVDLKAYVVRKGGTLPEEECLRLLMPVMDALIVVHSVGVLHRDISPDNIYITNDGGVKLLDFGAARQVLGEKSKSLSVVLKPGFAPIEQYQTRGKQGQWTDVYALAATLYYCLTGQIPEAAMDRVYEDRNKKLSSCNITVSGSVTVALDKALQVRPEDRYRTVYEFKQALLPQNEVSFVEVPQEVPVPKPAEPGIGAAKVENGDIGATMPVFKIQWLLLGLVVTIACMVYRRFDTSLMNSLALFFMYIAAGSTLTLIWVYRYMGGYGEKITGLFKLGLMLASVVWLTLLSNIIFISMFIQSLLYLVIAALVCFSLTFLLGWMIVNQRIRINAGGLLGVITTGAILCGGICYFYPYLFSLINNLWNIALTFSSIATVQMYLQFAHFKKTNSGKQLMTKELVISVAITIVTVICAGVLMGVWLRIIIDCVMISAFGLAVLQLYFKAAAKKTVV